MKRGLTLVELLVVIGIIGILSGVLLTTMSGGGESARAASCLANLKNLAAGCQTYGMANNFYPLAGNKVYLTVDDSLGTSDIRNRYAEVPGWISTMTKGYFPGTTYRKGTSVSMYSTDIDETQYALTNGALWKFISQNAATYVCPAHVQKSVKGPKPQWSYLMSAYFGWDSAGRVSANSGGRIAFGSLANADRILLFSEIPFCNYNNWQPDGEGGGTDTDAILQYSASGVDENVTGAKAGAGGNEELGVNHKKGKNAFVHVAFADGHVEQLRVPMKGKVPDTSQMRQLATWLATGMDVSANNGKYQKIEK